MKNLLKRILGVFLAAALVVSLSGPVLGAETASDTATTSTDSTSSSNQTVVVQNSGGGFGFVPFSPLPFLPPLPFPAWFPPTQSITIINNTSDNSANQAINLKILELLEKILDKLNNGTASDTADIASGTADTGSGTADLASGTAQTTGGTDETATDSADIEDADSVLNE